MDLLSMLRTMGALGVVLGLLAGALWVVKRYNISLPGSVVGKGQRVAVVERTGIDSRRSIALVRRDGREHLILLSPEGNVVIESGIIPDEIDRAAAAAQAEEAAAQAAAAQAMAERAQENFKDFVGAVLDRSVEVRESVGMAISRASASRAAPKADGEKADAAPSARSEAIGALAAAILLRTRTGLAYAAVEARQFAGLAIRILRERALETQKGVASAIKQVRAAQAAAKTAAPVRPATGFKQPPPLKVTDAGGNIVVKAAANA